ncbi:MAG TPA: hypothetical protein VI731_05635 [Bacteroidia bacterium]|nr:hypothetical protein [Bacteroidia bacterium]
MKNKIFALLIICLLLSSAAYSQCAMCKAVAETGNENGQNIAGGLNNAILYLMAAPYLLLFVFFRKKIFGFLKELRGLWR